MAFLFLRLCSFNVSDWLTFFSRFVLTVLNWFWKMSGSWSSDRVYSNHHLLPLVCKTFCYKSVPQWVNLQNRLTDVGRKWRALFFSGLYCSGQAAMVWSWGRSRHPDKSTCLISPAGCPGHTLACHTQTRWNRSKNLQSFCNQHSPLVLIAWHNIHEHEICRQTGLFQHTALYCHGWR